MDRAMIKLVVALVFFAMSWWTPDPLTSIAWFIAALVWTWSALKEAKS